VATMNDDGGILRKIACRGLPALLVFGAGWFLLSRAVGGWGAAPQLLLGLACIVLAAIIAGPPLARLLAEPTGSLFYPIRRYDRPLPMYSVPAARRKEGRYEEAMQGYRDIAERHPGEVKPYIEMIDIAVTDMQDPDKAEAVFHQGLEALRKDDDRQALHKMYHALRSRLETRRERQKPRKLTLRRSRTTGRETSANGS